ncbi:MAG: right-handed parallel beta-helix repeat-containing protein [Rubrivivax sp.]|nr:right-handed parallel beta-helix repeat-containing protein [Rubrivivax sp.]
MKAGDTLVLAAGNYGVTAGGADTGNVPGLPIFNLNGTAAAPIVITGPATGPLPVLMGRSTHNTVRLSNASHIVVRRLEVNGRDLGAAGVAVQGPCNNITIEDCYFHGFGDDQQTVAISTTGQPTWGWIVRRNLIVGAGTGMYFGNSTGDSPFVAGLIEYNVVRDTIGYGMQVKRQAAWGTVPAGMPTGKSTTIIRHNVFAKSGNSSTGDLARPNLLVGDCPPSGAGSSNDFAIYGNLLYENPSEGLFQCEGNVAFYANVLVTSGTAVRVQTHDGAVRNIRIFHNTVVAGGTGIAVSGGAAGTTQRVVGNAVFAGGTTVSVTSAGGSAADNVSDTRTNSAGYLASPLAAMPSLDLFPKVAMLKKTAIDLSAVSAYPDWNRDFNGAAYDSTFRGAYSGEGSNPGWRLAIAQKPMV